MYGSRSCVTDGMNIILLKKGEYYLRGENMEETSIVFCILQMMQNSICTFFLNFYVNPVFLCTLHL